MALLPLAAKKNSPNILDIKESITDDAIIFPESFETDSRKLLESWYMKNYTATDERYRTMSDVPVSDEVMIKRLQAIPAVIEMPYNQIVRQYIERYTRYGRPQVAALLGLSHYYMPIFEQALEAQGLPLELKYLPVIESALDPNAVSKHGATGLWQFMLGAAKGLGLEVNSLVDERRDPYLSSETAAAFLKDLYSTYGDWSLAIAAYNCGPGAVNKAIRRSGIESDKKDFWAIYKYLPQETRGYVPMFIAANYVMTYYKDHNISPVVATKPLVTDTVCVNTRLHFNQISKILDIPVEELRILNPQFRADIIPGSQESPYYLILPSQQIHAYIMSEDAIKEYDADKYARRVTANPGEIADNFVTQVEEQSQTDEEEQEREISQVKQSVAKNSATAKYDTGKATVHKVKAGESLASIASLYGVAPADIKSWNNLRRNAVRTGQQLRIVSNAPVATTDADNNNTYSPAPKKQKKSYTAQDTAKPDKNTKEKSSKTKSSKKTSKKKQSKPVQYKVREGENLTVIAKKNGVTVDQLKKANGLKDDNLRAGKELTIPSKSSLSKSKKNKKTKGTSTTKKKSGKKSKKKRR